MGWLRIRTGSFTNLTDGAHPREHTRKVDAVSAAARDVDFGHLWRQLRAAGWTSRRPRGLQTEWRYTSPDGVSVLLGEEAVVKHVVEAGLSIEASDSDGDSTNEDSGDTCVRASQIETSVDLSQNTINALFGTSSDSEVELSQHAVSRAFEIPTSDLQPDESQREAASSLQLLSEASGAESCEEGGSELASNEDVVNLVQVREQPSGYETISSDESDGVAVKEDDEDVTPDEPDDSDNYLSDGDAVAMDEAFISSLRMDADAPDRQTVKQRKDALRSMEWGTPSSTFETNGTGYPGLDMEVAQPVSELRAVCHSPLLTLFYFMPKSMWVSITTETNRYGLQQVDRRAREIQTRQAKQGEHRQESLKTIRRRLRSTQAYEPHEILHVLGLLVARMLCPQKRFAAHWSMVEDGAVPAGNFGRYMGRNRCQEILRDLHFVDNETERTGDKLWKLRSVVTKIQQSFLAGWSLPAVFSFDEGVLPATSKRNSTRMFMPDKPHRYGSKMTCDSRTAYCHRFEMYVGKRRAEDSSTTPLDNKTGAAAVVRNLNCVLGPNTRHRWHAVVVDRFYSSVLLAIELLKMNIYVVGTIMTNRLGLDKRIKAKSETRPGNIPRGTFSFSRSVAIPTLVYYHWWDRKPVHYLCTGAVMTMSTIERKIKQIGAITVPCPAAVNDYQQWMGGVDVHDQLRLQSYSLQTSTKFKKYYKSLFLGFVDLVLVNAYISHKETAKIAKTTAMTRREWYGVLQNQLLQLKAGDFTGIVATPPPLAQKRKRAPPRITHVLDLSEDWVTIGNTQKRRQRSCKVCALLRVDRKKKSFATTYFCERCSIDDAKCWLCNKIRREYKGTAKTCFEIWHDDFEAGEAIPPTLGKRVVMRRPGQQAGLRKKTRRELQLLGGGGDDADDEAD